MIGGQSVSIDENSQEKRRASLQKHRLLYSLLERPEKFSRLLGGVTEVERLRPDTLSIFASPLSQVH